MCFAIHLKQQCQTRFVSLRFWIEETPRGWLLVGIAHFQPPQHRRPVPRRTHGQSSTPSIPPRISPCGPQIEPSSDAIRPGRPRVIMATGLCCQEAPWASPFFTCPSRCKRNGPSRFLTTTQCLCHHGRRDLHCVANGVISTDNVLALIFFSWIFFLGTKPCLPQRGGAFWSITPALADAQVVWSCPIRTPIAAHYVLSATTAYGNFHEAFHFSGYNTTLYPVYFDAGQGSIELARAAFIQFLKCRVICKGETDVDTHFSSSHSPSGYPLSPSKK